MYKSLESMSDKLYYESVLPLSTCVSIYPGGVCYQSGVSADGLYQDTSPTSSGNHPIHNK